MSDHHVRLANLLGFQHPNNDFAMTVVGYDANQTVVYQTNRTGARYLYQIAVDTTAQTVTLIGQNSQTIVIPWVELWQ